MTTDRNDTTPAKFDWLAAAKEVTAHVRAAEATKAQRMEGVSQGLRQAANREATRHTTKNYGTAPGARKWSALW